METIFKYMSGVFVVIFFLSFDLNAQTCSASQIQAKLDSGKSLYTVIQECPSNATNDFTGKNYAGGIIAYVNGSRNGTGIISASADANTNSTWTSMWLETGYFAALTPSGIGSGSTNTDRFCQSQGSQNDNSVCGPSPKQRWQNSGPFLYGFYFATQYQSGGYTDWYLPSKDELTTARTNLTSTFLSCPSGGWWSSTQVPSDYDLDRFQGYTESYAQGINVAGAFAMDASGNISVVQKMEGRCIRAFRSFGPWIDSLGKTVVEVGDNITIYGNNFDSTPINNVILFPNGLKATPNSGSTSTSLLVTVPPGTTSGIIRVVSNEVQSNTSSLTIVPKPTGVPIITSFSKEVLVTGSGFFNSGTMIIYGENFSPINTVTFAGGKTATSSPSTNPNQFSITIPTGVLTGPITVSSGGRHSAPSSDTLWVFDYSTPASGLTTNNLNDVAISSNQTHIVAVGDQNQILISQNGGVHWLPRDSVRTDSILTGYSFHSVVFDNSSSTELFAIWGEKGYRDNYQLYTLATNTLNWASRPTTDEIRTPFVTGNALIATKNNTDIVKRSGFSNSQVMTWSTLESGTSGEISDFASNGDSVITVGQSGQGSSSTTYWVSPTPVSNTSWSSHTSGMNMISATWGSNLYVSAGYSPSNTQRTPTINYSVDGVNWIGANCNGTLCGIPQRDIAFNEDLDMFFTGGVALQQFYSFDGKNWKTFPVPASYQNFAQQIHAIVPSNDGFVMVGGNGFIGVLKVARPSH